MTLDDNLSDLKRVSELLDLAPVALDFVTSICGAYVGSGAYRSVYEYNLDNRYVVKIEPLNSTCNLVEYLLWEEIKGLTGKLKWVKDWFAPILWISPNSRIMVMRKTTVSDKKKKPDEIPAFMWDVKADNFGWIGNKFVCHDYSNFYSMTSYSKKMTKVSW